MPPKPLAASGIPYALLRNGWYTENYLASAPPALEHGVFIGAAGDGKIASATRADYAAAAAKVIAEEGHAGKIYELAGDNSWTLSDLAAELSKQSGKNVTYQNLTDRSPNHFAGSQRQRYPVIVTNWLFFVASPRVIFDNGKMTREEIQRARCTGTFF